MKIGNAFTHLLNGIRQFTSDHAPQILIGSGIVAMLTATGLAVKATPDAWTEINEYKAENNTDRLTPIETVKVAGKYYIPAAVSSLVGIGCFIGSAHASSNRIGALTTAAAMSERALEQYKDKIVDTMGEKKAADVRKAVAEDNVSSYREDINVIHTGKGDTLMLEPVSGRYFYSDINSVKAAVNEINHILQTGSGVAHYNTFCDLLGIERVVDAVGHGLGWHYLRHGRLLTMNFDAVIGPNDTPIVYLDYNIEAIYR